MREAVHAAGHGLAAIEFRIENYSTATACKPGECRYRGSSSIRDINIWTALAGPAAERHFFGEGRHELVLFSGTRDIAVIGNMTPKAYADWDDCMTWWANKHADNIWALAGELA
jgi:hypothetical protein